MKLETIIKYFVMICGVYFIISYLAANPQVFADLKIWIDDIVHKAMA